jgi:YegS/Rv2252/BmrU family lipid kinase
VTAQALVDGATTIVAVGGDGTLNEVANGFFLGGAAPAGAALGLLPLGTGGDFRKTLGIPSDMAEAAAAFIARKLRAIDVGRIQLQSFDGRDVTRHFVNIADCGIGGKVVDRVNRTTKALGGRLSFQIGSMLTLLSYKPQVVEVKSAEGNFSGKAQNVVVANCRYFGGGMRVAPMAEPDDGLFDVIVFGDIGRGEALRGINQIYKAQHLRNPKIQHWRSTRLEITSDEEVLWDVDGELAGRLPSKVELLPGAIPFVVP